MQSNLVAVCTNVKVNAIIGQVRYDECDIFCVSSLAVCKDIRVLSLGFMVHDLVCIESP